MDNKQFDSIEQSAMAVVLCKGKILAIVEDIYGRKVLSLPKGHNEQGETLLQTAIRECFEETNIVWTLLDPLPLHLLAQRRQPLRRRALLQLHACRPRRAARHQHSLAARRRGRRGGGDVPRAG